MLIRSIIKNGREWVGRASYPNSEAGMAFPYGGEFDKICRRREHSLILKLPVVVVDSV